MVADLEIVMSAPPNQIAAANAWPPSAPWSVEFLQLYHAPWIDRIRADALGAAGLGWLVETGLSWLPTRSASLSVRSCNPSLADKTRYVSPRLLMRAVRFS